MPWVRSWCSPLEQQVQYLLSGGEGSVGAQEDGDVGEVTALKGRHQVLHQLLQSASLHRAHLAGLIEVQGRLILTLGEQGKDIVRGRVVVSGKLEAGTQITSYTPAVQCG